MVKEREGATKTGRTKEESSSEGSRVVCFGNVAKNIALHDACFMCCITHMDNKRGVLLTKWIHEDCRVNSSKL